MKLLRGQRASTAAVAGASRQTLLLAGLGLLLLGACGAPERPAGTVVYASGADLESANPLVTIHPLARQVQRFVLFVTLARYDEQLRPSPYAARRWDWSDDRRTLTLRLVAGLAWHDGTPTTARDAAFTIDAARDPATGYPRAGDLAGVREVRAPDDSTLVLRFATRQPAFPAVLCELPILPAHLLDTVPRAAMRRAAFNMSPVGNGPFRFAGRVAGQRWAFTRNDAFPAALGGPPRIQRLVVAVVDEATTKFAGLVSGELDVAGIAPTMASLVRRDSALRVVEYPVLMSSALVFNTHRAPFDDVRVRHAVALSIDRARIIDAALAGYGVPAAGPVPPDNPLAAPAPAPRPAAGRADSLLDAAGWRRDGDGTRRRAGRALAFDLLTVGTGDNAVEQLVQADLAARGIRMAIRPMELGAFLAAARAPVKDFDALLTGVPGDLSLSHVAAMYHSQQAGGALDYGAYHTPRLDATFDIVRAAADTAQVRRAWLAVQAELARTMPAAWLFHSRGVQGVSRRLRGVRMDLRGEMPTVAAWETTAGETATRATAAGRGGHVTAAGVRR